MKANVIVFSLSLMQDNYSCNAVEFDIKQKGLDGNMQSSFKELTYQYLCVLMFMDEELDVDKTTAIIT